jgi:hypothetical protein
LYRNLLVFGALALLPTAVSSAGIYAPAAGQSGSTAIAYNDPQFVAWASGISVQRGPMDISNPSSALASYGLPQDALGPATANAAAHVVSLGDGGTATVTFDHAITNGSGFDFAVFENGITDTFLELAFVEVSSDGQNYFRFPAVSLTQTATQVGGFGALDPTNLNNLAGKYRVGYGTPFDLSELDGISPLLNVNAVTSVRFVDVVGSIQDAYATYDSQGHKVNDPWTTPFASSGFDLTGVGVIHAVPEPSTLALLGVAGLAASIVVRRRVIAKTVGRNRP